MIDRIIRNITLLVVIAVVMTIAAIGIVSAFEPTADAAFITARQLYGLTAFGVLLGACLIGPVTAVFPRMPLRRILLAGRRSIGVSAYIIAVPHVVCYVWPMLSQGWRDVFNHGTLWVIGLALGLLALSDLSVLAWTSRDASVTSLGGQRWKQLHRTVYASVAVVLLHSVLVGADFGFAAKPKDEADYGSLVVFSTLTFVWLVLFWLRRRGMRWPDHSCAHVKPVGGP